MQLELFTVLDVKAKVYLPPFTFRSRAEAVRAFSESAHDPKHMFGKHPEDFILFAVGTYDDNSGLPTALNAPEHILSALVVTATEPIKKNAAADREPALL